LYETAIPKATTPAGKRLYKEMQEEIRRDVLAAREASASAVGTAEAMDALRKWKENREALRQLEQTRKLEQTGGTDMGLLSAIVGLGKKFIGSTAGKAILGAGAAAVAGYAGYKGYQAVKGAGTGAIRRRRRSRGIRMSDVKNFNMLSMLGGKGFAKTPAGQLALLKMMGGR